MNWLYKLLGFKKFKIAEADDDCITIIGLTGKKVFKTGKDVWIK